MLSCRLRLSPTNLCTLAFSFRKVPSQVPELHQLQVGIATGAQKPASWSCFRRPVSRKYLQKKSLGTDWNRQKSSLLELLCDSRGLPARSTGGHANVQLGAALAALAALTNVTVVGVGSSTASAVTVLLAEFEKLSGDC